MIRFLCVLCGEIGDDICTGCRDDLPWLGAACSRCARPLPSGAGPWCGRCVNRPTLQAATVAALRYEFPIDRLIHELKFRGGLPPGRLLGVLLADVVVATGAARRVDAVVPVPLHPKRLRERGFNQALELARPVSRATRLPILTQACRRVTHAPPQSALTGAARTAGLAGAYRATARVAGLRVAVVDDVYTTGTTIAAVTDALLHGGATRVEAWCVARGGADFARRANCPPRRGSTNQPVK